MAQPTRRRVLTRRMALLMAGLAIGVLIAVALGMWFGGGDDDADPESSTPTTSTPTTSTPTTSAPTSDATPEQTQEPTQESGTEPESAGSDESEAPRPKRHRTGQKVPLGAFDVTVIGVGHGLTEVSGAAGTATASPGHRFATVRLTVGNPGSTPLRFLPHAAVVDQHGTSHSQDTEASVALGEVNAFVDPIEPGETRDATMTVELPRQAKPVSFEIREELLADPLVFDLR